MIPRIRAATPFALLNLIPLVAGCGADGRVAGSTSIAEWRLGEPSMSIGVVEGDERYQFGRIVGAVRLHDGRIAVADQIGAQVTIFDRDGIFRTRFGGSGSGPGEFQRLSALFPYRGDSIAAYDISGRRISIFDANGNLGRSFISPVRYMDRPGIIPSQSCCQLRGVLDDGSFVIHPPDDIPNEPGPPRTASLTLLRLSDDGARIDTIGTFPTRHFVYDASRPNNIRSPHLSYGFSYAAAGDGIVGGAMDDTVLERVRGDGTRDTLQLPLARVPIDAALKQVWTDAMRRYMERQSDSYDESDLERMTRGDYADFAPLFTQVHVDRSGRIWLARWSAQAFDAPSDYLVIAGDGPPLARIELPAGVRAVDIGEEDIVLVHSDELGVQRVVVYPVMRQGER
jgi:hypothetical protein